VGQYGFKLPDIGEGTAEAEIVEWHVKDGDIVEEDQPLVDMMTEKATVELTSPVAGKVLVLHGGVGEKAAVGSVIVTFEAEGAGSDSPPPAPAKAEKTSVSTPAPLGAASVEKAAPKKPDAPSPSALQTAKPNASPSSKPAGKARPPGESPTASPAVRRRADELGVKLQYLRGSGPEGRIMHADLDALIADDSSALNFGPSKAGYAARSGAEDIPVIGMRRQIAERMQLSKRHIPHFAYVEEVDVTELEKLRQHLNSVKTAEQPKLTLLPFIVRALVNVLPDYPQINATYDDEAGVVHQHAPVHVGIAAQTPKGLMVPVVRNAEARDPWDVATEIARLATAAREGKATRDELTGGTITVTSLGPLGGVVTTPIINRPEVAIVGPNKITDRLVLQNGQVVTRKMMNLSSSFDHRVVDGYAAAEFIQKIKAMLEHPATLFLQ
jgi:2-oxoisovalerate dehydrogenase E2 component (dihydrolipoyl transacylase)